MTTATNIIMLGYRIIANMKRRGDNGFILKEHDVVWLGKLVEQFKLYVVKRLRITKSNLPNYRPPALSKGVNFFLLSKIAL